VKQFQEGDPEVVGHDGAVETPGVAQNSGEQRPVSRRWHAVDVGIGVHDRTRLAFPHDHFERDEQHVSEFTRTDRDRREVTAGLRRRVSDEVLESCDYPCGLEATDVRRSDGADEIRVLADSLLDTTPAGIPHHVEHRGKALVDADRAHVRPDAV